MMMAMPNSRPVRRTRSSISSRPSDRARSSAHPAASRAGRGRAPARASRAASCPCCSRGSRGSALRTAPRGGASPPCARGPPRAAGRSPAPCARRTPSRSRPPAGNRAPACSPRTGAALAPAPRRRSPVASPYPLVAGISPSRNFEQRRFSRPVRPHQPDNPGLQLDRQGIERAHARVRLVSASVDSSAIPHRVAHDHRIHRASPPFAPHPRPPPPRILTATVKAEAAS